ncbi:MAG: arsenite methyltransferase [Dehalococcoidia bacterium]|nr:arsenite methyltransferase [Dehalococcoidia bacterium]
MNSPIELKVVVSESYADQLRKAIELDADACCGDSESLAAYPAEVLEKLPGSVVTFGCGNPVALASMQHGETVLDLGSGAGLDCFLAAEQVGETGAVIGVDFTQDMIDKANENAAKLGLDNVSFKHGDIEALPLENETVDVIISNCVINLAPDKDAVFREAFRVLRPGGRIMVSDIVLTRPATESEMQNMALLTGCVSGSLPDTEYADTVRRAGFADVAVETAPQDEEIAEGQFWYSASISGLKP